MRNDLASVQIVSRAEQFLHFRFIFFGFANTCEKTLNPPNSIFESLETLKLRYVVLETVEKESEDANLYVCSINFQKQISRKTLIFHLGLDTSPV